MKFYGLLGQTLAHSISPEIHHKIYEIAGIEAAYKKFELQAYPIDSALIAMKVLDIRGSNVTIPYKESVIPYLDEVSSLVQKLKACNTITNVAGKLFGDNTDYAGIALTFKRHKWEVAGYDAYILGSGGASKAVAQFLQDEGAQQVTIVSRTPSSYPGDLPCITYEELSQRNGEYLINTTPIGTYPKVDASPVSEAVLRRFNKLFDLTYNPAETRFLQAGRQLGIEGVNGLEMLIGQAVRAVELWEDKVFASDLIDQLVEVFSEGELFNEK